MMKHGVGDDAWFGHSKVARWFGVGLVVDEGR